MLVTESNLAMVHYSNAYFAVRAFAENNPGTAILIGTTLFFALVGIIGVMQLKKLVRLVKELGDTRPMSDRERERVVMQEVSYAICSGMEDAVAEGKLTRQDARQWYRRLGNIFDMKDLLPKGQSTLKEEIRERVAKMRLKRVIIIMPGDKPVAKQTAPAEVEAGNVVVLKPRLGSKLTARSAS